MIKKSLKKTKENEKLPQMNCILNEHYTAKSNNSICSLFKKIAQVFKHKMNIFDKSSSKFEVN
jgi:hypothetical protein